ncbi:Conserved_hypothetical protein [Hexamita inflata]|uniref:Uncharacterized protein n=1 Tax=Hexamita inflata TaxID=28002 RepID=A0ABP1HWX2_9EUKA
MSQCQDQPLYVNYYYSIYSDDSVPIDIQKNIISIIKPKQEYDGIISLGNWCLTGISMFARKLYIVSSPLNGFGIKTWENLMRILDSRFANYWLIENMVIGKVIKSVSHKHRQTRDMYVVYDNYYNMYSNHQFDADENSATQLLTYSRFKNMLDMQIKIFLKQCDYYERIMFVLRVMDKHADVTTITEQNIIDLNTVLTKLRSNKPFELRLNVPIDWFEHVKFWVQKNNLTHFHVLCYIHELKNVFDEEFETTFQNVKLADDHWTVLLNKIIGVDEKQMTQKQIQKMIHEINGWEFEME